VAGLDPLLTAASGSFAVTKNTAIRSNR